MEASSISLHRNLIAGGNIVADNSIVVILEHNFSRELLFDLIDFDTITKLLHGRNRTETIIKAIAARFRVISGEKVKMKRMKSYERVIISGLGFVGFFWINLITKFLFI